MNFFSFVLAPKGIWSWGAQFLQRELSENGFGMVVWEEVFREMSKSQFAVPWNEIDAYGAALEDHVLLE